MSFLINSLLLPLPFPSSQQPFLRPELNLFQPSPPPLLPFLPPPQVRLTARRDSFLKTILRSEDGCNYGNGGVLSSRVYAVRTAKKEAPLLLL